MPLSDSNWNLSPSEGGIIAVILRGNIYCTDDRIRACMRFYSRWVLSPVCLPIPPHRHVIFLLRWKESNLNIFFVVPPGVEPGLRQSKWRVVTITLQDIVSFQRELNPSASSLPRTYTTVNTMKANWASDRTRTCGVYIPAYKAGAIATNATLANLLSW